MLSALKVYCEGCFQDCFTVEVASGGHIADIVVGELQYYINGWPARIWIVRFIDEIFS